MMPSDHFVMFYNEMFKFLAEQGPQALDITLAPASRSMSSRPSRSAVALTWALPGITISPAFGFKPASRAARATEAARERSW